MSEPKEPFVAIKALFSDEHGHYADVDFHNVDHAKQVHKTALDLLKVTNVKLSNDEKKALAHACFYHDAGFHVDHEQKGFASKEAYSAHLAEQDLKETFSAKHVGLVKRMILATHRDASPRSFLEQLMRASDLKGLVATEKSFLRANEMLRREREFLEGKKVSDAEWVKRSSKELEHYATHEGKWIEQFHPQFSKRVRANSRAMERAML